MKEEGKKHRKHSLKTQLIAIIIFCWLVPVLGIGGFCAIFYNSSVNDKINSSLRNEVAFSTQFTVERLQNILEASRNATYDGKLDGAYQNYLQQPGESGWVEFYQQAYTYLYSSYTESQYLMSALYTTDRPGDVIYCEPGGKAYSGLYAESVHNKVQEMSQGLGTRAEFFIQDDQIYLVRNLVLRPDYHVWGVLVLQLNPQHLFQHLIDKSLFADTVYFTFGEETAGIQLKPSTLSEELQAKQLESAKNGFLSLSSNSDRVEQDNGDIHFYSNVKNRDFTFSCGLMVDSGLVYGEFHTLKWVIYLVLAIMVPVIIFAAIFIIRNITRPIDKIIQLTKRLKDGELGVQLEESFHSEEFCFLGDGFNKMSKEMKELFDTNYSEQQALKDAKINALQSQMSPQFLSSALDMMHWQAKNVNDGKISGMIEALTFLLDAADSPEERESTMIREIEYMDAYLYLVTARYGDALAVNKEIDPRTLDCRVPKLILQPLLENSISPNLTPDRKSSIQVHIYFDTARQLILEIRSSGRPCDPEDIRRIRRMLEEEGGLLNGEENQSGLNWEKGSFVLEIYNLHQRIRLLYGKGFGLTVTSKPDDHMVIRAVLPQNRAGQPELPV